MRSRLTAWLSALLLFNAIFAVPVTCAANNRVSCCVVYSQQKKHRAEQFAETPQLRPPAPRGFQQALPRQRASVPILDSHLFQRPPPALS